MRADTSGCHRIWEGDTNLLLNAGAGGTFMKAFTGAAFTGAGLASCHTHGGTSRWRRLPARPGGASSGAEYGSHTAAGSGQVVPQLCSRGGGGARLTWTSCTLESDSLSDSSSDEEDSEEEEAAPPPAEKNRDIRTRAATTQVDAGGCLFGAARSGPTGIN